MRPTITTIVTLSLLFVCGTPAMAQDVAGHLMIESNRTFDYSYMTFDFVEPDEGDSSMGIGLSWPLNDWLHMTTGGTDGDTEFDVGFGVNFALTGSTDIVLGMGYETHEEHDAVAYGVTARIMCGEGFEVAPYFRDFDENADGSGWGIDFYYALAASFELAVGTEEFDDYSFGFRWGF